MNQPRAQPRATRLPSTSKGSPRNHTAISTSHLPPTYTHLHNAINEGGRDADVLDKRLHPLLP